MIQALSLGARLDPLDHGHADRVFCVMKDYVNHLISC